MEGPGRPSELALHDATLGLAGGSVTPQPGASDFSAASSPKYRM